MIHGESATENAVAGRRISALGSGAPPDARRYMPARSQRISSEAELPRLVKLVRSPRRPCNGYFLRVVSN